MRNRMLGLILMSVTALSWASDVRTPPEPRLTPEPIQKDLANTNYLFDRRATKWVEGTITAKNNADWRFSMTSVQHAFAAKYAKMLSDIHEQTVNFSPPERAEKALAARMAQADALKVAQDEAFSSEELQMFLPEDRNLHVVDENGLYPLDTRRIDSETGKVVSVGKIVIWDEVNVGDRVIVGMDGTAACCHALVIIRISKAAAH